MRVPSGAGRTLAGLKQFKYLPLAGTKSIRLLELQSATTNSITCALREFPLKDAPSFNALSYTWGSPLTQFSVSSSLLHRTPSRSTNTLKAQDGGREWSIGNTIIPEVDHESLDQKRSVSIVCDGAALPVTANLRDALQMLCTIDIQASATINGPYFWIDAICVNQKDIPERNGQVSLMSAIFESANSVIVWLGPEDEFTADALEVLKSIGSLPDDAGESAEEDYTHLFEGAKCPTYERLGVSPLRYQNWLGFIAFINRPWFERVWVVQELALARSATVICGKHQIPWKWISRTLKFTYNTRWYHHLSSEKLRHVLELRKDPGIYRKLLRSDASIKMAPLYLDRTREKVADSKKSSGDAPQKNGLPLRTLIETHRFTKTSDARDKIYALLGLADPKGAPFKSLSEDDMIRPDYNLSIQELYMKATRAFLLSSRNLGLLSNVQDPSRTRTHGLPSWVPDFSVEQYPYPLMFRGFPRWRANGRGAPRWQPDPEAMCKGLLRVQGMHIDRVDDVAKLQDESSSPSEFWSDIVQVASRLDDRYPISYSGEYRPSRVEVLWRTLMTNTYNRSSPAPAFCGELFVEYILNLQIRHSLNPWSTDVNFQPHQLHVTEGTVPQWRGLLAAEPADSPYGLELYEKRFADVVGKMFKGEYNSVGLSQLQHELDYASGSSRRVFRTNLKLLGTGTKSLRPGDEIWILRSVSIPFLLRKLPGGNYQLIGEAYVHGVMIGKAMEMGFEVQELVIE